MSELIHRHIPYLRRFARALVGHQSIADRLVAEAVQQVGDRLADASGGDLRLMLLQALVDAHRAWIIAQVDGVETDHDATLANERIVASRVRSLPHEGSIALLLSTLEGLSVADIAWVMRFGLNEARAQLREAQRVLEVQQPSRVLIIEDQPVIAMDIAGIVGQAGHTVTGIAATRNEAVAMATHRPPDLILADISLADDSSGIEAVGDICRQRRVPAIFITAFPERLLPSAPVEPSLLISKPFSEHLLRVAIAQALELAGGTAEAHAGVAD